MDFCANPVLKLKATLAVRLFATALAMLLVLSAETISSARVCREQSVYKQVAAVIEKTLNNKTKRQAFSELLAVRPFQQLSSAWMTGEPYPTRTSVSGINRQMRWKA